MMKNVTKITLLACMGALFMQQPIIRGAMAIPKTLNVSWASNKQIDKQTDLTLGVKVTTYNYSKTIPGLSPADVAKLLPKKDGFVIYVFDGSSEIARYHIAGSLLKRNKPKFIMFMPRTTTNSGAASWTREFLTFEDGNICIYRIWIEKDPAIGLSKSVDFGKRVVIASPSGKAIDQTTVCADNKENISFKDVDGTEYMWDSTKEKVVPLDSSFKKVDDTTWSKVTKIGKTESGFSFYDSNGKIYVALASNKTKKIDPLKVNLDGLKKGFQSLGTATKPLKVKVDEDTGAPDSSTTFQPGEALALLDLLCGDNEQLKEPIAKGVKALADWVNQVALNKLVTQPPLSDEQKKTVAGWIKQVADTVINQSKITAEIKFRAREPGGITSILKKATESTAELDAKKQEEEIKNKLLQSDEEMKRVLAKFAKVPSQKSWGEWFDKVNKDIELKVLITYLATSSREVMEEKLKLFFKPGPSFMQKTFTISSIKDNSDIIRRAKGAAQKPVVVTKASVPVVVKPIPGKVQKPAWMK